MFRPQPRRSFEWAFGSEHDDCATTVSSSPRSWSPQSETGTSSVDRSTPRRADVGLGVQPRAVPDRPHAFEVTVAGEVDVETSSALDAQFDALIGADARFIVLDLSGVTFLDSSGLRSIVRAANALAEREGRLTCAGLSGAAAKVLEISGLLEHLRDGDATVAEDQGARRLLAAMACVALDTNSQSLVRHRSTSLFQHPRLMPPSR